MLYSRTDRPVGTQWLLSRPDINVAQLTSVWSLSLCLRDTNSMLSVSILLTMDLGKLNHAVPPHIKQEKQKKQNPNSYK